MLLVAILTVRREALADLRRYERAAAAIMARHGGAIERAVLLDEGGARVRELHLVRFVDEVGFAAYRADPALADLRPLRDATILDTQVMQALDGPDYHAP